MQDSKGRGYLIDFGFAMEIRKAAVVYQGAIRTASDQILTKLAENRTDRLAFTKEDDLVSLVRVSNLFRFRLFSLTSISTRCFTSLPTPGRSGAFRPRRRESWKGRVWWTFGVLFPKLGKKRWKKPLMDIGRKHATLCCH